MKMKWQRLDEQQKEDIKNEINSFMFNGNIVKEEKFKEHFGNIENSNSFIEEKKIENFNNEVTLPFSTCTVYSSLIKDKIKDTQQNMKDFLNNINNPSSDIIKKVNENLNIKNSEEHLNALNKELSYWDDNKSYNHYISQSKVQILSLIGFVLGFFISSLIIFSDKSKS